MIVCLVTLALVPAASRAQVSDGAQRGVFGGIDAAGQPARDRTAPPATGASLIRGRVVAIDTGQPLRRAQVRISAPEIRESRVTTTDAEGRYEFRDLPAGRYNLSAGKGSYVTLSYGQTRPNQPGRPLQVADNQLVERVDFSLPRGGVITGRVVDEFGEPVADATVVPLRNQWVQGQRRPMPAGRSAQTNDIGEFRVFGLPPGDYLLTAMLRGASMVNDVSDDRSGYAPTYYPGTPSIAEAQPITIGIGATASDVTLPLIPTRTARISGIVLDQEGRAASGGNVMVTQRSLATMFFAGGGMVRPDGTFTINNLAPGEYVLRAMPLPRGGRGVAMAAPFPAMATVTVNGEDLTGIVVAPPRMIKVTGRVVVPPAAAGSFRPALVRVGATPAFPEPRMGTSLSEVRDDHTFEFETQAGTMVIRVSLMEANSDLVVREVRLNGMDVTDRPIDFSAGRNLDGVEIELTNTPPEVTGVVTDGRGNGVKDYTVLVFPRDRDRWIGGARQLATARPDQDGRFRIRTLRPGEYYAIALDMPDMSEVGNPDFLEAQSAEALALTLNEGETRTLDLRLTTAR
jgi:protocatechuate 3,4-dioxygenase beta subunit